MIVVRKNKEVSSRENEIFDSDDNDEGDGGKSENSPTLTPHPHIPTNYQHNPTNIPLFLPHSYQISTSTYTLVTTLIESPQCSLRQDITQSLF